MENIDNEAEETGPEDNEAQVSDIEELYVPKRPIAFDETGKFLIYESKVDKTENKRHIWLSFTLALIP